MVSGNIIASVLILLLTCLTCFSQSVELRSVTILGGVNIGAEPAAAAPSAGSIHLSNAVWAVAEDAGPFVVYVMRTNGSSGSITTSVAQVDGTAANPADYVTNFAQLIWTNGETTLKSVSITISNDVSSESSESLTVYLTNQVGGTMTAVSNAVVTITDDDTAASGSPGYYASGSYTSRVAASTLTITNLEVAGANKLLLVAVGWYQQNVGISSVKWNGTEDLSEYFLTNYYSADGRAAIWRLAAPASATANLVVTWSNNVGEASVGALVLTNVNQATPIEGLVATYSASTRRFLTNDVTGDIGDMSANLAVYEQASTLSVTNNTGETLRIYTQNTNRASVAMATKVMEATTESTVMNFSALNPVTHMSLIVNKP